MLSVLEPEEEALIDRDVRSVVFSPAEVLDAIVQNFPDAFQELDARLPEMAGSFRSAACMQEFPDFFVCYTAETVGVIMGWGAMLFHQDLISLTSIALSGRVPVERLRRVLRSRGSCGEAAVLGD